MTAVQSRVIAEPSQREMAANALPFNHEDDYRFWSGIHPRDFTDPTREDSKQFHHIMEKICGIPGGFVDEREKQNVCRVLKRIWKLDPNGDNSQLVRATQFVALTKYFGPFRSSGDVACVFLQQVKNLMELGNLKDNTFISPFAGHMTQEQAEATLQDKDDETYLIRFSESLADSGGYSLAVKANGQDVRHYQIKGDPAQAALSDPYHAGLRLVHRNYPEMNDRERRYGDINAFFSGRLDDEIEDNIYCTYICPGLPFNAVFRGYD